MKFILEVGPRHGYMHCMHSSVIAAGIQANLSGRMNRSEGLKLKLRGLSFLSLVNKICLSSFSSVTLFICMVVSGFISKLLSSEIYITAQMACVYVYFNPTIWPFQLISEP